MTPASLQSLISVHQTGDAATTAEAVFVAASVPVRWRALFGSIVRDECRRRYRLTVASSEFVPTAQEGPDTHQVSGGGGITRGDYLAQRIAIGGGRYVLRGEATIADHRDRIALLTELQDGLSTAIDLHVAAIEALEASGASCLYDLESEAA